FIERTGAKLGETEAKNNFSLLKQYKSADGTSLVLNVKRIEEKIIIDGVIKDIDKENQNIKAGDQNRVKIDDEEIERKFTDFLKKNCGEFQKARSFGKIKIAIYQFFDKYLDITDKIYTQKVVLSNLGFFQSIVQDSVKKYAKDRNKIEKRYKIISKWNVPIEDYYSKNSVARDYKRCVM